MELPSLYLLRASRGDGCIFQTDRNTEATFSKLRSRKLTQQCLLNQTYKNTSLFFDALGTFPNGIPKRCTLSAGKTWQGERQVVGLWASGEYPELEKQGELVSSYVLSEKRASQGERLCIRILLAMHSALLPRRAQAAPQYWQLQSLLLLPLHKKSMLTLILAPLPGSSL